MPVNFGAGGVSVAIGELAPSLHVHLDRVPLKYAGLSYTEIWISESQERMVAAVPPAKVKQCLAIFAAEGVEAVDLGEVKGVIENVGLRVTQVRDVQGVLWYVRNGEIIRVGNQSQGWSRIVLDISLAYGADVDKARTLILGAATAVAKDKAFTHKVIEAPEIWGIENITGDAVVLRLVQQVGPQDADEVARELRLRVKEALDKAKISLADTPLYVEVAGKAVR